MPILQHLKWWRRLFSKGANRDVRPELLPDGYYTDAQNMRPTSVDGNAGAVEALRGETQLSRAFMPDGSPIPGADTYTLIGSAYTNGYAVEFWASNDGSLYPSLIRINGQVMAYSFGIPYRYDRPLQIAVVEQCRSGILYPADHLNPPLFWDIQAIVNAFNAVPPNNQAFFTGFNINTVLVGLNAPPSYPKLNRQQPLIDLGGPVGLPVGQYAYSIRWVTANGDRTNWGPESPLISVPSQWTPSGQFPSPPAFGQFGSVYPGMRTYGGDPSLLVPTNYAINLRIRIDNRNGYSSIEIKRRRYNDGQGLTGPGIEEVVGRINIQPGQTNIITFVDNPDAFDTPEIISDAEAQQQIVNIKEPKAVDYADGRLKYGNFQLENPKLDLTFNETDGRKLTSITKKLVTTVTDPNTGNPVEVPDGYTNPYNSAYYKSYRRGEKYGFGIQCWDGALGKYPAVNIPGYEDYQLPNRLDIKGVNGNYGADSLTYSDDPIYRANVNVQGALPEGPVGATFDVITQGDIAKTDTNTLINVAVPNGNPTQVRRTYDEFRTYDSGPPLNTPVTGYIDGGVTYVVPANPTGYQPWRPTGNPDDSVAGYLVPPTAGRFIGAPGQGGDDPNAIDNESVMLDQIQQGSYSSGRIFGQTTHALGNLLYGVTNIPSSVSAFTVVRTPPAGRIVAQGFGSYTLYSVPGEAGNLSNGPAVKDTNSLEMYFPEEAFAYLDQATREDLIANPSRYQAQFVAPYGFYSEIYGYYGDSFFLVGPSGTNPWASSCIAAWGLDMISYARIVHDEGQVNIGEPPAGGMGVQPVVGADAPWGNYVGYDMWRSNSIPGANNSYWRQAGHDGNTLMSIDSIIPITTGRTTYWRVRFVGPIYAFTGVSAAEGFNGGTVRRFHQPWHVVNIIRVGAETPNDNIVNYVNTGCHIKMTSCVGVYTAGIQDFEIFDERWEDCVNRFGTDYRYTYIEDPNLGERPFLCITGNTQINITTIVNDLNANGSTVVNGVTIYGVYEQFIDSNGTRYLRFGVQGPSPNVGSRIVVKYDPTAPIEVFGGDIAVAPMIHAVQDNDFSYDDVINGTGNYGVAIGGLPLPYAGFTMNPRYYMPESSDQTEADIYINFLHTIRQWCIAWDAEVPFQPAYLINATSTPQNRLDTQQFFPAVHYVPRLYRFNGSAPASGQAAGFYSQYDLDYPAETAIWKKGGIRFLPAINYDYAKQPDIDFKGSPKAGYTFDGDLCTGLIASTEFDPQNQDSPGLRTFLVQNIKNISNELGEIKLIATALSGRGQNQYAYTQKGVCLVLTNKNVLTGASGEQVSTQSISNYWGEELWITRNIGLPDQFWRLFAKGHAPAGQGFMDTFFWPDRRSWYRMRGDTIQDIARNKYLSKILPILKQLPEGYTPQMSAFYDPLHHEVWISIKAVNFPDQFFVYSALNEEWTGSYTYNFDGYLSTPDGNLGMRLCETYQLEDGFTINGNTREAWVMYPLVGDPGAYKEAVRSRIVGDKPDAMELYDKDMNLMVRQDQAAQEAFAPGTGTLWVKRYDSWEIFWNRVDQAYNAQRPRPQDEFFYVKIIYNTRGERFVTMGENQLQNIK